MNAIFFTRINSKRQVFANYIPISIDRCSLWLFDSDMGTWWWRFGYPADNEYCRVYEENGHKKNSGLL